MDNANSFAKLLMQTFQELSKESQNCEKETNSMSKTKTSVDNNETKSFKETSNHNRHHRKRKVRTNAKKEHHRRPKRHTNNSKSTPTDSETDNEQETEEQIANLEQFVVSLLKFAPNQMMLVSELGLKITDIFDKSIKQMTGLKSKVFFDGMNAKQIITIENTTTKDGAHTLSLAKLITKRKKVKKVKQRKQLKKTKDNRNTKPQMEAKPTQDANDSDGWQWNGEQEQLQEEEMNDKEQEQSLMVKKEDLIDEAMTHENVAMDDEVSTNQIITDEFTANPYVNAVTNNVSTKKNEVTTPTEELSCDDAIEMVRCAILRNFVDGSRDKIMLSSVNAYCSKYTGTQWKKIMIQKPAEFIADMVHDGWIIKKNDNRNGCEYPFVVLNKTNTKVKQLTLESLTAKMKTIALKIKENKKKGKKRKWSQALEELQSNTDPIEPPAKKQKQDNKRESIEPSQPTKIVLSPIKLKQQNGMGVAQRMIDKFAALKNKHNVHFHFAFDQ